MSPRRRTAVRTRRKAARTRSQAAEVDGDSERALLLLLPPPPPSSSEDSGDSGSDEQWEMPPSKRGRSGPSSSPRKALSAGAVNGSAPCWRRGAATRGRRETHEEAGGGGGGGARWRNIEEEDTDPEELKFRPSRIVGPQLSVTSSYSPRELFQLFFSSEVITSLIQNTNSYGKRANANFAAVTSKDMFSYIALVLYMGVVPLKTLLDYWRSTRLYTLPFPSSTMNRQRFNDISRCLHMNHPDVEAENELKKGTQDYDKLCKVRPLYKQILEACQTYYHPKQHISIDERMVASKARIGFKQYVKNKPTKWGFKLFVLADSSGYTVNFFIYDGKVGEPSGNGQSYDVVMRLLNSTKLGTGYKLYVDNYYTSPTLFRHLLKRKISACGTIRSTLRDYPKATRNKMPPKAARGTIRWLRQKDLLFVKWFDAREVTICSTMHKASAKEFVKRKVKNEQGRWAERQVLVPDCVKDYNRHMGGVDLSDALINSYNVVHKTKKWYKTLFYHFIDIAAVNAFILHRQLSAMHRQTPLTQKAFREALILELADIGSTPNRRLIATYQAATPVQLPRPSADPPIATDTGSEPDFGLVHLGHLPAAFAEQLKGVPSRMRGTTGRRTCVMCGSKTQVYCSVCLKTMCFNSSRNCYREFHRRNHIAS
ncbi:piggyBac transposable element-derived protein 4-like [Boleophthalmus pectinirostris]|uniref:piggyBac transposable element-derived protein 4-like n=1 Tax=Boleophthalmus pectinirostris TaxID=150288 RepID=UPI0024307FF8|nr:piggyBac transposable element-derived protein 4-like [Boleophthalmus pectinirostris]